MLDNGVKKYVLQRHADLHPLQALIGVSEVLQFLGVRGIFIGPIVASGLLALIQIFNDELRDWRKIVTRQQSEGSRCGTHYSHRSACAYVPETSASPKATPNATTLPAKIQRRHKR